MSREIRVSVAMATWNGGRYITTQLESLGNQVHLPCELIVCDDASTDDTLEKVRKFSRSSPFPVKIIRNRQRRGYSQTFFTAMRKCDGDWIAFCDQDDFWFDTKISDCVGMISENPGVAMVLQKALVSDQFLRVIPGVVVKCQYRAGLYSPRGHKAFSVWHGFLQTVAREVVASVCRVRPPINYGDDGPFLTYDKSTFAVANALGRSAVIERPAAIYRRHPGAATTSLQYKLSGERVFKSSKELELRYIQWARASASQARYVLQIARRADNRQWESEARVAAGLMLAAARRYRLAAKIMGKDGRLSKLAVFIRLVLGGALRFDSYIRFPRKEVLGEVLKSFKDY